MFSDYEARNKTEMRIVALELQLSQITKSVARLKELLDVCEEYGSYGRIISVKSKIIEEIYDFLNIERQVIEKHTKLAVKKEKHI